MARRLLAEADPSRIGTLDGSVEGLLDSLPDQPQQTVVVSDLGVFFENTRSRAGGNVYTNVKMRLLELFDCEPVFRRLSKNVGKDGAPTKRHTIRCDNPRVTLIGGINPALVESTVERNDWENGLMSRMLIVWAEKERVTFRSKPNHAMREWIKGMLQRAVTIPSAQFGLCEGFDGVAQAQWEAWAAAVEASTPPGLNRRVVGPQARAPMIAARLAMLIEWSRGTGWPRPADPSDPNSGIVPGDNWRIRPDALTLAISIATLSYKSAITLASAAEATTAVRLRRNVLDCIAPNQWVAFGDILKHTTMLKKQATDVLDTMVAEGSLSTSMRTGPSGGVEKWYMRTDGANVTATLDVPPTIAIPTDVAPILVPFVPPPPVMQQSSAGYRITIGKPDTDTSVPPGSIALPDLAESDTSIAIRLGIEAAERSRAIPSPDDQSSGIG
jgi:hypothetical protein